MKKDIHNILWLLLFCCACANQTLAQAATDELKAPVEPVQKSSYADFILSPDSTSQNYLFMAGIKYQVMLHSQAFSSNGAYVNFGINMARFFSKKMIVGAFMDLRPVNGPFFSQPSRKFARDFNQDFIAGYPTPEDSATAYELKNRITNRSLRGGSFAAFGVMLSLFPNSYGGILLSLKYGGCSYRLSNVYGNTLIQNGELDNLYFGFNYYQCELSFKPFAFGTNSYIHLGDHKKQNPGNEEEAQHDREFIKSLTCSVFFEQMNLKKAEVNHVKWTEMTNDHFISRYGNTFRFGVSVGFTLY